MNLRKRSFQTVIGVYLAIACLILSPAAAMAAYDTVPAKPYPTLTNAEIVSGSSPDVEIHLKFSNNVGAIDETQAGRYDMTGYNAANLTKFHLATADGTPVDLTVTPHPQAAMHTDESKYFYIFASGLDVNADYVLRVDEDLYANMGNSLGSPYEVDFNIGTGSISFNNTEPLPEEVEQPALYFVSSTVPNNSTGVDLNPSITLSFAYNVAGVEVLQYNTAFVHLLQGTTPVPLTITAGDDVKNLVVKPTAALQNATEYKLVIDKYLMANNGSTLSSPVNLYFTTKAANSGGGGGGSSGGGSSGGGTDSGAGSGTNTGNDSGASDGNTNKNVYFSDVAKSWAIDDINYLADLGAVNGNPDGTFLPNKDITRAEIVAILVRVFNLKSDKTVNFQDVGNSWAKGYISTAAACGLINGVSQDVFAPNQMLTRQELVAMVVRQSKLTLKQGVDPVQFKDSADAATWAANYIAIASSNGVIGGYADGSFKPQNKITRAEACHLIVNLLKLNSTAK